MKRLSLAIITTFILGIASFLVPAHSLAATGDWQRSVSIQSRWAGDFGSASFNQSVDRAVSDGANYIVLVTSIHQSNIYSTDVQSGWDTPTDQALTSAIAYIHSKGAHAVINIHDDPNDGQWRALINPSDRGSWFANYSNQLTHFGSLAQATGAEEMVLGTELSHMTSNDYNSTNGANWTAMIQKVRSVYSGQLTYSAQHDGYLSDLTGITFWNALDYIGISAYYNMGYDSSVAALKSQWAQHDANYVRPIATRYGKKVLFTEVGFASKSNTLADPGTAYQQGGGYDPALQANAYQATMDYWSNVSYFGGLAWWDWSSDANAGGNGNTDYTPQNKPAEATMKQYFTTNVGSGGGTTNPTPPSTPATYAITGSASTATVGSNKTVGVAVTASQPATGVLVDVELYDANGNKVAQKYFENQSLTVNATTYSLDWTPATAGTYTIKAGVFTANWASNLLWNNQVTTVTATNQTTSPPVTTPPVTTPPTPTPPTPTPPVTTPPTPTPPTPTPPVTTPPTQPPTAANVTIWWPGNGAVSGVQPFKALVDGMDVSKYNLYWQVDNGTLNQMGNNSDPIAHKESLVDLSSWKWSSNKQYTITFVAKDMSGAVIASKSVVITVN